jgi:two-component system phosphate regulon response regulator PhoB
MTRVLIVDDDPDIREMLEFKLVKMGFEVQTVADGEAGLSAASEVRPDVVLLDWMMPKVSGLEVCAQLRAMSKLQDVVVIMLTARCQEEDKQRGFAVGVDDYIMKPFTPRELVSRLEALAAARSV